MKSTNGIAVLLEKPMQNVDIDFEEARIFCAALETRDP
jgi:hypothetical protein